MPFNWNKFAMFAHTHKPYAALVVQMKRRSHNNKNVASELEMAKQPKPKYVAKRNVHCIQCLHSVRDYAASARS